MNKKVLPPLSQASHFIKIGGLYQHYKGLNYKVLGIARHSETLEELVVYQALYGEGGTWVRPLGMFLEKILVEGNLKPRFKLIDS
jgi:hypothetical protein